MRACVHALSTGISVYSFWLHRHGSPSVYSLRNQLLDLPGLTYLNLPCIFGKKISIVDIIIVIMPVVMIQWMIFPKISMNMGNK